MAFNLQIIKDTLETSDLGEVVKVKNVTFGIES